MKPSTRWANPSPYLFDQYIDFGREFGYNGNSKPYADHFSADQPPQEHHKFKSTSSMSLVPLIPFQIGPSTFQRLPSGRRQRVYHFEQHPVPKEPSTHLTPSVRSMFKPEKPKPEIDADYIRAYSYPQETLKSALLICMAQA